MDKQNQIPEAVASITYSIQTGTGFNALFTVRGTSGIELLNTTPSIEVKFKELGIVPQPVKRGFNAVEKKVVGKCPKCGADAVESTTKAGKVYHKCSTQKYDFTTKTTSGCDWVNWDPTGKEAETKSRDWDNPMPLEEYDK